MRHRTRRSGSGLRRNSNTARLCEFSSLVSRWAAVDERSSLFTVSFDGDIFVGQRWALHRLSVCYILVLSLTLPPLSPTTQFECIVSVRITADISSRGRFSHIAYCSQLRSGSILAYRRGVFRRLCKYSFWNTRDRCFFVVFLKRVLLSLPPSFLLPFNSSPIFLPPHTLSPISLYCTLSPASRHLCSVFVFFWFWSFFLLLAVSQLSFKNILTAFLTVRGSRQALRPYFPFSLSSLSTLFFAIFFSWIAFSLTPFSSCVCFKHSVSRQIAFLLEFSSLSFTSCF